MLDVNLVLQEAEALLDSHYTEWQQHGSSRVQVYHVPQKHPVPVTVVKTQGASQPPNSQAPAVTPSPAALARSTGISEVVANLFVLVLLGVLKDKLARGGARPAR